MPNTTAAQTLKPRHRVFCVDDHPLVREWLAGLVALEPDLEICGQAEDAPSALAAIPLACPEVVTVDLSLPRGSGLELIKDLRAQEPRLRLLVLSMHDEVSTAERAFRAGANGYVVKRESSTKIVEAIRTVLAGRTYVGASLSAELASRIPIRGLQIGQEPEEVLSDRELEVFRLRGQGCETRAIAESLGVSIKTIGSYDARIKLKLGLDSAAKVLRAAVLWCDRRGKPKAM